MSLLVIMMSVRPLRLNNRTSRMIYWTPQSASSHVKISMRVREEEPCRIAFHERLPMCKSNTFRFLTSACLTPVLEAVYWCSGYHISLTPKRSSVRSRDRSDIFCQLSFCAPFVCYPWWAFNLCQSRIKRNWLFIGRTKVRWTTSRYRYECEKSLAALFSFNAVSDV